MKSRTVSRFLALSVSLLVWADRAHPRGSTVQDEDQGDEQAELLKEAGRSLRRTVLYLASYRRVGRRAGTTGSQESALWLVSQLQNYGIMPAGEDRYLQPFDVPLPVRDGGDSWIQGEARFEGAQQVVPLGSSAPGGCEGPVEFHGLGIMRATPEWSDYPGDLAPGTIVLLVDGEPDDWDNVDDGSLTYERILTAAQKGAGAVLLAPHPDEPSSDLESFRPGLQAPIPALRIGRDVAEALCPEYARAARASLAVDMTRATGVPACQGTVAVMANVEGGQGTAYNVLARIEGRGGPTVMVGAHLDHLGLGGLGSLSDAHLGEVHHGADDNASGVAVVWNLVDLLLGRQEPAGDVIIAFWSGQALGALGSRHWLDHPTVPIDEVTAYLNVDGVGRAESQGLKVLGVGSSPAFGGWIDGVGRAEGISAASELSFAGIGGSDLQPFLLRGIPGLHLTSGFHSDRHTPADDVDRFESEGAARVTGVALRLIHRLQAEESLPFSKLEAPPQSRKSEVRLGFFTLEEDGGRRIVARVDSGGSADAAGLLPGDRLLQVGDTKIDSRASLERVEQLHMPGDVVPVRFLRRGTEHELRMTLRP